MKPRVIQSPGATNSHERDQLIATLVGLLRDVFRLRSGGASAGDVSRAQGYADGFMLSLEVSGVCSRRELLQIVTEARRGDAGPATKVLQADDDADCEARIVAA